MAKRCVQIDSSDEESSKRAKYESSSSESESDSSDSFFETSSSDCQEIAITNEETNNDPLVEKALMSLSLFEEIAVLLNTIDFLRKKATLSVKEQKKIDESVATSKSFFIKSEQCDLESNLEVVQLLRDFISKKI